MIGPNADEAFLRQRLECLANRRPRHFEALAKLAFIEPCAGWQYTCDNLIAQNSSRTARQITLPTLLAARNERQQSGQRAKIILGGHNTSTI
jgi:hypothetical protein